MKHDFYKCLDDCDNEFCNYCRGGLLHCKVCGGAEVTLPLECPGRRLTEEEENLIACDKLNFFSGQWWIKKEDPVVQQEGVTYAIGTEHEPNSFGMWRGPHPDLKEMLSVTGEPGAVIFEFEGDMDKRLYQWDVTGEKWIKIE